MDEARAAAFFDAQEACAFSEEKLRKVALCESSRLLFDVYCLLPGQSQKTHAHDDIDKIYVVLSGQPTLIVGGQERTLGAEKGAFAPAGVPHGVRNDSQEPATLLVFQARGGAPARP